MKNFVLSKETKLLAYKINNGIFSPYFISIIYRFFRWNSPFFVSRCIAINDSTINAQTTKISDYVIYRFCGFRENIVSLFYFRYPVSPELFSHSDLFHSLRLLVKAPGNLSGLPEFVLRQFARQHLLSFRGREAIILSLGQFAWSIIVFAVSFIKVVCLALFLSLCVMEKWKQYWIHNNYNNKCVSNYITSKW